MAKTLDWNNVIPDWRFHGKTRKIEAHEWEADFGSAPREAFFQVGGYDEDFDRGWSCENVNLAQRVKELGYAFMVFPGMHAVALDHDATMEHPFRKEENYNGDLLAIKKDQIAQGDFVLGYLSTET